MRHVSSFLDNEDGATAIEYGLIAALISVVCIGAWQTIGVNMNARFWTVAAYLGR